MKTERIEKLPPTVSIEKPNTEHPTSYWLRGEVGVLVSLNAGNSPETVKVAAQKLRRELRNTPTK